MPRHWRGPLERRARLRQAAVDHVAREGLGGLNLHTLAAEAGMKFDIARHHYRTNQALLLDVVRTHQTALGEKLADPILASRELTGTERLRALIAAVLEALVEAGDWHRAATVVVAAYRGIAYEVRNADAWLRNELASALGPERELLARSLLVLIEHWALLLPGEDAAVRAECVGVLMGMAQAVGGGVGRKARRRGGR
jgi:AcrR family transcriptional regulator